MVPFYVQGRGLRVTYAPVRAQKLSNCLIAPAYIPVQRASVIPASVLHFVMQRVKECACVLIQANDSCESVAISLTYMRPVARQENEESESEGIVPILS